MTDDIIPKGWRPIETAPKDGTRILMYQPPGRYQKQDRSAADRDEWVSIVHWHQPGNPSMKGFWLGGNNGKRYRPTLWRPVPYPVFPKTE